MVRPSNHVRISIVALAVAMLAAPRAALAVDTIPFTEVNGGLIQVQGSVDGLPPVPMLVNLGAGIDVLATDLGGKPYTLRASTSAFV